MTSQDQWIEVGTLADIPVRGARVVKTAEGCVALFRTAEDEVFALDDRCPHRKGPLSDGIVHGRSVTCPLHSWVISLEDGQAQGADSGAVRSHAVRVEAGRLFLETARLSGSEAA